MFSCSPWEMIIWSKFNWRTLEHFSFTSRSTTSSQIQERTVRTFRPSSLSLTLQNLHNSQEVLLLDSCPEVCGVWASLAKFSSDHSYKLRAGKSAWSQGKHDHGTVKYKLKLDLYAEELTGQSPHWPGRQEKGRDRKRYFRNCWRQLAPLLVCLCSWSPQRPRSSFLVPTSRWSCSSWCGTVLVKLMTSWEMLRI